MSKRTGLKLTCKFSDFAQAYCGTNKYCEILSIFRDAFDAMPSEKINMLDEKLEQFMESAAAEVYVTDELPNCDEISVIIYYAPGQYAEYSCDCVDAKQLLKDIIDQVE